MVDHTDVHLLVPHPSGPAFAADHVPHARRADGGAAGEGEPGTVVVALFDLVGAELPVASMTEALAMRPRERWPSGDGSSRRACRMSSRGCRCTKASASGRGCWPTGRAAPRPARSSTW